MIIEASSGKAEVAFTKTMVALAIYYLDGEVPDELATQLSSWVRLGRKFADSIELASEYVKSTNIVSRNVDYERGINVVQDFADALYANRAMYKDDPNLDQIHADLINDSLLLIRKDSEPALNRMTNKVHNLGDNELTLAFTADEVDDQGDLISQIRKVVKRLVGRSEDRLSLADAKEARASNPDVYEQYLELNRNLNAMYKEALRTIIRSSGESLMDIEEAVEALKSRGVTRINLPLGFDGKVDEAGKLYTTADVQIDGGVSNTTVTMNPTYDAEEDNGYVFTAVPFGGKKPQHYYTVGYRKDKRSSNFKKVDKLGESISNMKSRWRQIMVKEGSEQLPALILELVYQTSARIGSNPTGTNTEARGIRTIKVEDVRFSGQKMKITYLGKSNKTQTHIINGEKDRFRKKAIELVKELRKGKKKGDYVFSEDGNLVSYGRVAELLKKLNSPVTLHKFRHLRGTEMATRILENSELIGQDGVTQAQAKKWLKEELTKVGKVLGHFSGENVTPNTAIKYYINPDVAKTFFGKLGLRVPSNIPQH
jgi:hypothetical protein